MLPAPPDDPTLRALRRSEALFRSLWETTDDAVLMVAADNRIAFANPAVEALLGHAPAQLVGQPLMVLMPERLRSGHEAGMQRHMATGEKRLDWRGARAIALHASGQELAVEIRFARLDLEGDGSGETLFVGFMRDIRARLAAEEEARAANARLEQRVAERTQALQRANERLVELDRLKSEFLASMSHELRTPLNSVLGFASLLQHEAAGPLNEEQRRQLGFIRSSGEHLLALINDVLDLSRIESGRMELQLECFEPSAAAQEVLDTLRPLAEKKGLVLTLQVGDSPLRPLQHDRRKLRQVLLNLVGNAIKFTERGHVSLRLQAQGGGLHIEVEDSGVGIAAAQQPLLFEAFRQLDGGLARAHQGTGLGLHLTRRLLDLMGGRIGLHSTAGAGACFEVWLPWQGPGANDEAAP